MSLLCPYYVIIMLSELLPSYYGYYFYSFIYSDIFINLLIHINFVNPLTPITLINVLDYIMSLLYSYYAM
jgi:hypothetical protein